MEAAWCKYVSINQTNFGSVNDLWPVLCQAIIKNNVGLLLIGFVGTNAAHSIEKLALKI